jgi:UDP-N-acetylglucosamine pyrophosphorylase
MNVLKLTKKEIKANENGCIINGSAMNSVIFLAELPTTAVVDHIKVDGKFLEDINTKKIRYHVKGVDGIKNAVATVEFEDIDLDLYFKLSNQEIQDFVVYYHHEVVDE